MWIMTTDFSEHTPRQTRRVVRFTEPMLLTGSSPRADWRDAKLRGKTLFVVRHFVTLMAGTSRACSAVFETCRRLLLLGFFLCNVRQCLPDHNLLADLVAAVLVLIKMVSSLRLDPLVKQIGFLFGTMVGGFRVTTAG